MLSFMAIKGGAMKKKRSVGISVLILLGILGSLHSQDFDFQVNGVESIYTIPADTLVRNIHLSQHLSNQYPFLHGLDTLIFTFQQQIEDTVEYKFGPFMYSDGSQIYPTVNFLFEATSFSSLDSMITGVVMMDSQLVEGIRYVDLPGDSLSGFQVVLSGEDPTGGMAYIQIPYLTETCSDWRNFQPLQVGNIWNWDFGSPDLSATRLEIIDVHEDAGQKEYTVARERVSGWPYTLLPPDTFAVLTYDNDPYKIYWDGGDYNHLICEFRPLPTEWQQYGIVAVVPAADGALLYESSSMGGTDIWTWGIGRTSGGWDGGGSLDLWGYRLGDSLWGDIDHLVSVREVKILPETRAISAYPNPFNPSTSIEYDLPEFSEVSLIIYDISGREVNQLVSISQSPGSYKVRWNGMDHSGREVAGGMYFARLRAGDNSSVAKMVYLR